MDSRFRGNDELMACAFIGVGSNLGNREKNLAAAQKAFSAIPGIRSVQSSEVYETDPVGGPAQGKYLNAVWKAETDLEPGPLLQALLQVESGLGRVRAEKNGPRIIDLDLLFYGSQVLNQPGLTVPHPRLHEREFVLKPLMDLAPDFVHPVLKKTISVILSETKNLL